ncbi:hypothetical protein M3624_28145 [Priestia megaterium]|nr:hypothetical protein [Priestia megaterium]
MKERVKELKERRKKLIDWLWTLDKAYGPEEAFRQREEEKTEKELEINRHELFKLTGHDISGIRDRWSRLYNLLEERVIIQLIDLTEEELEEKYKEYSIKAEEPRGYEEYRSLEKNKKMSYLAQVIAEINTEEIWEATRL